jgi:hypothetical protein
MHFQIIILCFDIVGSDWRERAHSLCAHKCIGVLLASALVGVALSFVFSLRSPTAVSLSPCVLVRALRTAKRP